MDDVVYRIVEHDGGWAYKLGPVFSETFRTRADAEGAAARVAEAQRVPGEPETISWEDEDGLWHEETESGSDRPHAFVEPGPAVPSQVAAGAVAIEHAAAERSFGPILLAAAAGALLAVLAISRRRSAR